MQNSSPETLAEMLIALEQRQYVKCSNSSDWKKATSDKKNGKSGDEIK